MDNCIESYRAIAGSEAVDQLCQISQPLQGKTLTHVNSTYEGGGVAEILSKMVPLSNSLGIETKWEVIEGENGFFQCTKNMHNALQGKRVLITPSQIHHFEETTKRNAERLHDVLQNSDVVIVHDPQPIGLIEHFPERKGKWIWRCHIDASKPFWPVWKYIRDFANQYDAVVFSLVEFAHSLKKPMFIIPPSIDPLSEKNIELPDDEIIRTLEQFSIDIERPKMIQVSRFDRFKDPLGVIQSYILAKRFNPRIQLILAGGGASDDPEGEQVLDEVKQAAADDEDIHILSLPPDSHRTINALQRASDIVIQKSVKEGFGLTVTEALWKARPVIAGNVGGIRLQVINKHTGFVVHTPEGAAYRARYLLQNKVVGEEMGKKGKEYVREQFLLTRHLRDYLGIVYSLMFGEADRIELP